MRRHPRIAVVGGGPGGLYFAALAKRLDPRCEVEVWERNAPDDTFGFGVVLSHATLQGIRRADPALHEALRRRCSGWDGIDVHHRGAVVSSRGHAFAAASRRELMGVLQRHAAGLGATLRFHAAAPSTAELGDHDLVVAADGVGSATRAADDFGTSQDVGACRFIWLGTSLPLQTFKFLIVCTDAGVFQAHAYPSGDGTSTFIVETSDEAWRGAGFDRDLDDETLTRCERIFARELAGHPLLPNRSRWLRFVTVRNRTWHHGRVALLGDAAHTAHFSVGSGTRMAMEDAQSLAANLAAHDDLAAALVAYEAERRPVVERTQEAADASRRWFEDIACHVAQEPEQFAFNLITRSRRVTHESLGRRDPAFVDRVERWFAAGSPPMLAPLRLRDVVLPNRVVAQVAEDGGSGELLLVRCGVAALGGAGLVLTRMPDADDLARIVAFGHRHSAARIGVELTDELVAGARLAERAGVDLLVLDAGHGLECFDAVRAVWPPGRPIVVRLAVDEAVERALVFARRGADVIAGPARLASTVRSLAGLPTMTTTHDMNGDVLAGRTDLCLAAGAHIDAPTWAPPPVYQPVVTAPAP